MNDLRTRAMTLRAMLAATAVISAVMMAAAMPFRGGTAGAEGSDSAGRPPDNKCGLAFRLAEAGLADPSQPRSILAVPATRTLLQAERVIGLFRFHYDTAGTDAPALLAPDGLRIPGTQEQFVDSAGAVFNAVHAFETGSMGYIDPIQPAQGAYDVYIFNNSYYGETVPEARIGTTTPARYTTHINIDNDFQNFYSRGIAGLEVTAAHEFFHAIQFASYGYWNTDNYFMEISSTWMEDVVYGDVNDYYQYVRGPGGAGGYTPRGQFARPDFPFLSTDGLTEYSRAIFGKFIEKKYSRDVIRRAWELVPEEVAIVALDDALGEIGSSFREAFLTWSVWNATTGPDADTSTYYTEGRQYPRIVTAPVIDYTSPSRTISGSIGTASVYYYPVNVGSTAMSVIVANVLTTGTPARVSFSYEMSDAGDASYKALSNGLHVKLDVPDPGNWSTIETVPSIVSDVTPAPNPFPADDLDRLDFQIPLQSQPASVVLTVLTTSMERIFQGPIAIREDRSTPFVQLAEWEAKDSFGRTLGSGVYIFVLNVDGTEHTGKFAVVR